MNSPAECASKILLSIGLWLDRKGHQIKLVLLLPVSSRALIVFPVAVIADMDAAAMEVDFDPHPSSDPLPFARK